MELSLNPQTVTDLEEIILSHLHAQSFNWMLCLCWWSSSSLLWYRNWEDKIFVIKPLLPRQPEFMTSDSLYRNVTKLELTASEHLVTLTEITSYWRIILILNFPLIKAHSWFYPFRKIKHRSWILTVNSHSGIFSKAFRLQAHHFWWQFLLALAETLRLWPEPWT